MADGLAKKAASDGALPGAVFRLLKSAQAAVEHSAKLLGRVTYAANHHVVQRADGEGSPIKHILRDSVDAPRGPRAKAGARPAPKAASVAKPDPARVVKPWEPPSSAAAKRSTTEPARQRRKLEAERDAELLHRRVQEVGHRLRPSSQRPASERVQALRNRVLGQQCISQVCAAAVDSTSPVCPTQAVGVPGAGSPQRPEQRTRDGVAASFGV